MTDNASWGSDPQGPRAGIPAKPGHSEILVVIPTRMADGLRNMAIEAKQKPHVFNANLLAAAYSAGVTDTGDRVLERAVRGDLTPKELKGDALAEELRVLRASLKVAENAAKSANEALAGERAAVIKLRADLANEKRGRPVAEVATNDGANWKAETERARQALETMKLALVAAKEAESEAKEALRQERNTALAAAAQARLAPPPQAAGAQAEADCLSKAEISIIKGYYAGRCAPHEIARRVNVSVEAVRIVLKLDQQGRARA